MPSSLRALFLVLLAYGAIAVRQAFAQTDIDREPILYSSSPASDPIARLQQRIDAGETSLDFDAQRGYLPAVLKELGIGESSQTLVFSKTSFQQRLISPKSPRALYFSDDAYIGWVQRGDVLELAGVDPRLGGVFYVLEQKPQAKPRFLRDTGNCLSCHHTSRTHDVPGFLVRSVFPSPSGLPHFGSGSFHTTHASPMNERWGGWYVTGEHGRQRHMGNVFFQDRDRLDPVDAGANLTSLGDKFKTETYLTGHSDLVALMVLEHQTEMHNLIARVSYETRMALHQSETMNAALGRPAGFVSESAERRIATVCEELLEYMLMVDEAPLAGAVRGTAPFAEQFAERGPFDSQKRSLRQFDLATRLFKYPCSYLIYSEAFGALPAPAKERVYRRLFDILAGIDQSERFAKLATADRQAILAILRETKTDLPEYWRAGA